MKLLPSLSQVRVLPGTPRCRVGGKADTLVLGTRFYRFESDTRYHMPPSSNRNRKPHFQCGQCEFDSRRWYQYASVVQRIRTPVSDTGGRQFDSGRKLHIPVAHRSEQRAYISLVDGSIPSGDTMRTWPNGRGERLKIS